MFGYLSTLSYVRILIWFYEDFISCSII